MQALNHTRQEVLAERGAVAAQPWARLRGLIGRPSLCESEGLLLLGTKAIHTMGMRFAIDVVFLDEDGRALHLLHAFKPSQISPLVVRSAMVLELPAGTLDRTKTKVGDWIEVSLLNRAMATQADRSTDRDEGA
jgi:uncharacterized protein